MFSGLKDILHEMMQLGAFGAKLSWNVVYVNGARGMNVVEGQRSSRNEEMKVKSKEVGIGNQSF